MFIPSLRLNDKGIPILSKDDIEEIAFRMINDYNPESMAKPQPFDIESFAEFYLKTEIEYKYPSGEKLAAWYTLDRNGLGIKVSGSETLRILLPAFTFNGKDYSKITLKEGVLEVEFEGYICRYTVLDGTIIALDRPARNRNGHYETYAAEGSSGLRVQISIEKR